MHLPPDTPLGACRCACARLQDAQKLTDDAAAAASDSPEEASLRRWQKEVHRCGACRAAINDGSERAWTGRWDAPQGQYRYRCGCGASLCERCHDEGRAPAGAHGGGAGHAWEAVPPISSRNAAAGAGGESESNPWGRFGAGVSARSRERLKERTGL